MEFINFHMNDWVKVKLTKRGIQILREQESILNNFLLSKGEEPEPSIEIHVDKDGYTSFQAWQLFSKLGSSITSGPPPFDFDIKVQHK